MDAFLNEVTELPTIFALVVLACAIVVMIWPQWLVAVGAQTRQPPPRNLGIVRICMVPSTALFVAVLVMM